MSEDITIQLPQTGNLNPLPPPEPKGKPWGVIFGGLLAVLVALGGGFFFGTSREETQTEETLSAITQIAFTTQDAATSSALDAIETALAVSDTPQPTRTPTNTPTPQIPQAVILPLSIQVHAYADNLAPVVGNLNQDTPVEITGLTEDGLWFQIRTADDMEGFVPATALRLTGGLLAGIPIAAYTSPTPLPSAIPTQAPTITPTPAIPQARILPIRVSVYAGPGADFALVGTLSQNALVNLIGTSEDGSWVAVTFVGEDEVEMNGFIEAAQLELVGGSLTGIAVAEYPSRTPTIAPTETPAPIQPTAPTSPIAMPAGQLLVVREGPAEAFKAVGVLSSEQSVSVNAISVDGLWFQVAYPPSPTGLGWISAQNSHVLGLSEELPIVQGPVLPEPTPIKVVIEGGIPTNNTGSGSVATPLPIPNIEIADLPDDFRTNFSNLPDVDDYVYRIEFTVDGEGDGEEYYVFFQLELAQSTTNNQRLLKFDAVGAFQEDGLDSISPLYFGQSDGQDYAYFQTEDLCVELSPEESIDFDEIINEFPGLLDGSVDNIINETKELGVFGIVDREGLFGLGGTHYQFLGYRDSSAPSGYSHTPDAKVDLWFDESGSNLYAISMTYNLSEESQIPVEFVNEIDLNFTGFDEFEGVISVQFVPLAIGAGVENYTTPPSTCDYFLD